MHKSHQTWQSVKEYWMAYIAVPSLFAIISVVIRYLAVGKETTVSEVISWLEWVLVPAILGFAAVFFWHYFRDPFVRIEVKVGQITTCGYYARATSGKNEGDKEIEFDITLKPSKPVAINHLVLILSGKSIKPTDFSSIMELDSFPTKEEQIETVKNMSLQFHIPKELAVSTKKAQILLIADGVKRYSRRFPINFGGN